MVFELQPDIIVNNRIRTIMLECETKPIQNTDFVRKEKLRAEVGV